MVRAIFGRRFDISQFPSHLSPISCNVPPLSQLNVGPIAKRARFQCFNVPMFQHRFVAHQPLANSSCLPSPLFLNHIWICSQIIVGFVPRPSAHLFPISCGLVSNWEGGFAEQETPYLLLLGLPYFSIGKAFRPLAQWVQGTGVELEGLPGDCQILSQVAHILAICASPMPDPSATCASTWSASTRKSSFFKYSAQLFQSLLLQ